MGINKLPYIYDYWSIDPCLHYAPIASRISWKRFMEIKSFLRFVDRDTIIPHGQPGFDRLAQVQSILKFDSLYCPHRDLSVDEAMIKFKGKSKITQYIPLKPIKWGIKVWILADSVNGYIIDFKVYICKEGDIVEKKSRHEGCIRTYFKTT